MRRWVSDQRDEAVGAAVCAASDEDPRWVSSGCGSVARALAVGQMHDTVKSLPGEAQRHAYLAAHATPFGRGPRRCVRGLSAPSRVCFLVVLARVTVAADRRLAAGAGAAAGAAAAGGAGGGGAEAGGGRRRQEGGEDGKRERKGKWNCWGAIALA
jgi:hypothetical protein